MPGRFLDFDDDDETQPRAAPSSRMQVGEIEMSGSGGAPVEKRTRRFLDFDEDALGAGEAEAQPAQQPAPAERSMGDEAADFFLGAEEGLTLGNTANLGRIGAGIATRVSDVLSPSLERDGMEPEFVGERGAWDWISELTEQAQQSGAGKLGRAVGTGVTALGTGGAAGPSVAGQAAVGTSLSSAAAAGASDGDWEAMLAAMPAGAAFGAAGGALGSRMGVRPTVQQLGKSAMWGAGIGAATSPGDPIGGASRGAFHGALGRGLMGVVPASLGTAVRQAGQLGAVGAGTATGVLGGALGGPSRAAAQDVAYGTAPTMAWGIQSVLASGASGLPPADEQRLTEAVLSGDMDRLISANFALQQRNPAYAARLQRELEALQEEDE
ncbi:MAG TPA: hypothetical protein VED01_03250 [Burkholderiales bacterium]|nr:hypothetical protein [Burkholderiales bacterium]